MCGMSIYYLSGYLYGDGSVNKDQIRLYGREEDLTRVVRSAREQGIGLNPVFSVGRNRKTPTWVATWPQKYRGLWPDEILSHQRKGDLPLTFFLESQDKIKPFLEGLWDSDGCVSITQRKGRLKSSQKLTFVSAKPVLATLVKDLLFEVGVESTVSVGQNYRGETMAQTTVKSMYYSRFRDVLTLQGKKQSLLEKLK